MTSKDTVTFLVYKYHITNFIYLSNNRKYTATWFFLYTYMIFKSLYLKN